MDGWLSLCFIALCTPLALWCLKLAGGKRKPQKYKLPPGPWTLPVIGSLHHLASGVPHRKITELCRRFGPLMLLRLGEVPAVVVSSAEAAALVMKTNDPVFADRPSSATVDIAGCGGRGIIFAPYGDHWRQMRKVCIMELLGSTQVNRMEGIRAEETGNLLRSITASAGAATINVTQKVMALSNDVVTRAVFGGRFEQQDEYLGELHKAFELLGAFCLVDLFPSSRLVRWLTNDERRMKRSYGRTQRIITKAIEGRKATRAAGVGASDTYDEDLLDVLLRLQLEDSLEFPLTTETIGAVLFDVFAGATETIGSVLSWAMSELMHNPDTMAKTQREIREVLGEDRAVITNSDLAELHYMRMIIKEVLRLHPPGPLVHRMSREDCTIMGYDIPKGTDVYINIFAISRDPRHWNKPEEFRPERFDNNNVNYKGAYFEFIPFGSGRRQCPGIHFSSSVTEMVLTNFLYHFDWMLPDGHNLASLDMSEKFGLAVTKSHDLKLRAIPHMFA
uniref:Cytochrome P450 71D7 n=1 Tax=Aegilops tauschii subsp. strangulata TaxID=200361 RepID=A0A453LL32_AEGTS